MVFIDVDNGTYWHNFIRFEPIGVIVILVRCNTMQHNATQCNILQTNQVENHTMRRGGRLSKKIYKNPARAGWPKCLALVRAISRAEVDVIGNQRC